jgi:hypothetical protein
LKRGMVYHGAVPLVNFLRKDLFRLYNGLAWYIYEERDGFPMVLSTGLWLKRGTTYDGSVPLFMCMKKGLVFHGSVP